MLTKWLFTLAIVLSFAVPPAAPSLVNYLLQEEWCIVIHVERMAYERLLWNIEEIEA